MKTNHLQLPHHFTASGIVIDQGHILLVNHKRIGAWVPPGGHIEDTEMPEETVIREILEETGVEVAVLSPPVPATGDNEAFFLSKPLYVQSVLAIEQGTRYYHIDLVYLCEPKRKPGHHSAALPPVDHNSEVKEARWVAISELDSVPLAKNVREAIAALKDSVT